MTSRLLPALALLLLAAASPLRAQAPDPARTEAAERLLDVMDMERTLAETTDAMLEQQLEQNPELTQFADIMREFMERALDWSELRDDYVRMYADVFTAEEMRELREFYRTPLGRRILATQPVIAVRSNAIAQERVQRYMPEMQRRIMERVSGQ